MKTEIKNRFEACAHALSFVRANATRIPGARLPILIDELQSVVDELATAAGHQSTGHREFRAAACERLHFANLLREEMRFIALMAKSLDRQLYPGLRHQLRLPRSQSYLALIASARSFIEVLTPIKAEFIERSFPPDFIERLATLIDEIDRANQAKNSGLLQRMHSTASLMHTSSRGLALLSEMHAIITLCFRDNAGLLAEWQTTRHVRRPNQARGSSDESEGAVIKLETNDGKPLPPPNGPPPAAGDASSFVQADESTHLKPLCRPSSA